MTGGDDAGARATGAVTDLRLVALTPDRSHLVLEDSDSRQFRVPVDERLAAALRSDRDRSDRSRPGQLEIALESQLSPREIQARIRAGHSVEEVSRAAGISAERVERYASPVIAEREHVVEQAQRAPARRASGGKAPGLADLVELRLAEQSAARESTEWDAWRGDDDRWTVRLCYLAGGRARVATWTFDPRGCLL
ncbi:MAG: septation protein SepH [Actinomycetes bacterium]